MTRWVAGVGAVEMTAEQEAEVLDSWAKGAAKGAARREAQGLQAARAEALEALRDRLLEAEATKPDAPQTIKDWALLRRAKA